MGLECGFGKWRGSRRVKGDGIRGRTKEREMIVFRPAAMLRDGSLKGTVGGCVGSPAFCIKAGSGFCASSSRR
jgi:hypothetical protein